MGIQNNQIAVGLDIGTTKIVAMVGRKNEHGKLEILGVGRAKSLGVKGGRVNNMIQTIESIKEAVAKAEEASGYKITDVTVGVAGQHIRSLQHSDYITRSNPEKFIDESDLKRLINQVHKLVMLPGEEIIHVLPQEFKIDSELGITEPLGMHGSRIEASFHVVVGQIASIKNIARCVKDAGLNLADITLEPIASSLAALTGEEKEAGVALVDIGGGTTDIAVFKDNIIRHTAVIPYGGNIITEDIKDGCAIIEKYAEKLKVKFGSAWPGENRETEIVSIPGLKGRDPKEISLKKLSQIINARVVEILEQVNIELKRYGTEDRKKKLIAGLVMTGGGSNLNHIKQLTEYITGMDVRIGYSNEHIASSQIDLISSPEYATVVGLVLKGIERVEEQAYHSLGEEDLSVEEIKKDNNSAEIKPLHETQVKPVEKEEVPIDKEETPVEKKKERYSDKKIAERKPSILSRWADNFIKMINETE